jgi:diacylglycerol kinase family enzyme
VAGTRAFGGGSALDVADPGDRRVDLAVLHAGPRVARMLRAWGMRMGGLTTQRGVRHARGRAVELELPEATQLNVDGGICTIVPARFESRDEHVAVVVP